MGVSFLLTILAAIGGVEDLYPWLKALHPVGVLLFFAWFLHWNCGKRLWSAAAGRTGMPGRRRFPAQRESMITGHGVRR